MATDYYFFHTIEGPFGSETQVEGYYSIGGWLVSPEDYERYKKIGLGGVETPLYPAYVKPDDTNSYIVPEPPPLSLNNLEERVRIGGYYGNNLAYSFINDKPVYYYYPEAKSMFPEPIFPSTPDASFSAGYEDKSGYIGIARWEGRNLFMRGGTGYEKPEYYGNMLAEGYSYPEGFWNKEGQN